MTAQELITILQGVDPNTIVVVPASDHAYRRVGAEKVRAVAHINRYYRSYSEYYGEQLTDASDRVVDVVCIA